MGCILSFRCRLSCLSELNEKCDFRGVRLKYLQDLKMIMDRRMTKRSTEYIEK